MAIRRNQKSNRKSLRINEDVDFQSQSDSEEENMGNQNTYSQSGRRPRYEARYQEDEDYFASVTNNRYNDQKSRSFSPPNDRISWEQETQNGQRDDDNYSDNRNRKYNSFDYQYDQPDYANNEDQDYEPSYRSKSYRLNQDQYQNNENYSSEDGDGLKRNSIYNAEVYYNKRNRNL